VPAAAVIPAPKVYIKVVAVEELVVGSKVSNVWSAVFSRPSGRGIWCCTDETNLNFFL